MMEIVYMEVASGEIKRRKFNSPYLAEQFIRKIEHSEKLRLISIGKLY